MRLRQSPVKLPSKRGAGALEVPAARPSKKQRTMSTSEDDMDWLRHEMADIKGRIADIAEHLSEDTDHRLDELLRRVRN